MKIKDDEDFSENEDYLSDEEDEESNVGPPSNSDLGAQKNTTATVSSKRQDQQVYPPELLGATRQALATLEAALAERLEEKVRAYPDDTGLQALKETVEREIQIVRSAGIDALDKNKDVPLPADHGPDLDALQKKSKDLEILNQVGMSIIREELAKIHTMRTHLLARTLREESEQRMKAAYNAMIRIFPALPPAASAWQATHPPESQFLAIISSAHKFNTEDGHFIEFNEQSKSLTSDDPTILGYAAAAAGYRTLALSGPALKVLEAAWSALRNGVEEVKFDAAASAAIHNPNSYGSDAAYAAAQKEFRAIKALMAAQKAARAKGINPAFNEGHDELHNKAIIFKSFPPNETSEFNHKKYLEKFLSLDGEGSFLSLDRASSVAAANFAHALRDQPYRIDTSNNQMSSKEYIWHLFSSTAKTPIHRLFLKKAFDERYEFLENRLENREAEQVVPEQEAPRPDGVGEGQEGHNLNNSSFSN